MAYGPSPIQCPWIIGPRLESHPLSDRIAIAAKATATATINTISNVLVRMTELLRFTQTIVALGPERAVNGALRCRSGSPAI